MGSVWIGFVRSLRARAMQTYMVAPESISRLNLQLDETAAPDSTAVLWRACQLSACHSGLTSRCNLGRSASDHPEDGPAFDQIALFQEEEWGTLCRSAARHACFKKD
jgi:hypothetical protein